MTDGPLNLVIVCFRANDSETLSRSAASLATTPSDSDTEGYVWAKRADKVSENDIYHLAALIGWNAVERLNVGNDVT